MIKITSFKAFIFLACASLMVACNDKADPPQHDSAVVHPQNLQGTWTLSHGTKEKNPDFVQNNHTFTEWDPCDLSWEPIHLRFRGDSMEVFEYPYEYHGTYAFEMKGDTFVSRNSFGKIGTWGWNIGTIRLNHDSLFRTVACEESWITGHYFRDTLNEDTLALLRRDSVNATVLQGKWRLDTFISVDYDESYALDLPFDIPDSLVYSADDIPTIEGRITSINVNSTPRPFRFGFVNKHRIWLRPAGWFSEGLPPIQYDRDYFISLLDRQGINQVEDVKSMEVAYAADIGTLLGQEDSGRTVRTTEKPSEISKFIDLLSQLSQKGNGKEFRYRSDSLPSWRIRFVDHHDLWHNVLFIGNKIETPYGSPGDYYTDPESIELEAKLYGLMQAFMSDKE